MKNTQLISRRSALLSIGAMAGTATIPSTVHARDSHPFLGTWSGVLKDGSIVVRAKITFGMDDTARLVIVDQGNMSVNADSVKISGASIWLQWSAIGISYAGNLKGKNTLKGTVSQNGKTFMVVLTRGDLYPDPTPVLPPAPLTTERLQALYGIAKTPALGAAWAFKGGKDQVRVIGLRSIAAKYPVTVEDQWHLGSDTKSMTATLAARLVDKGKLTWTTTVGETFGSKFADLDPNYVHVNFLHLLSHFSGLPHDIDESDMRRFSYTALKDSRAERLEYAKIALRQPPIFPVGQRMSYSNSGYIVAGTMMEIITGQPWESLMETELFAPLGLESAGFGAPGAVGKLDEPFGHRRGQDFKLKPIPVGVSAREAGPVAMGPCGTVHIALHDLLTYLKAHRDTPTDFLSESSWQQLHTAPFGENSALGWGVDAEGTLRHSGSNGLWRADVMVSKNMVFAGVTNAVTPDTQSVLQQLVASAQLSQDT